MILVYVGRFSAFRDWEHEFPMAPDDLAIHYLSPRSVMGLRGRAKLVYGYGATQDRMESAVQDVAMLNATWSPDQELYPYRMTAPMPPRTWHR